MTVHTTPFERAHDVIRTGIGEGQAGPVLMAVATSSQVLHMEALSGPAPAPQITEETLFLWASITKPVVATAIMQLVERGQILLSDRVTRWLPAFASHGKGGITLWHLLNHTSGLAEEIWDPLWQRRAPAQSYLGAACGAKLHFAPGTAFEYCSLSYWLLAEVIRQVTGLSHDNYLREQVLAPLGMNNTHFCVPEQDRGRKVPIELVGGSLIHSAAGVDYFSSLKLPSGGLWGTAPDLVRFGQATLRALQGESQTILSVAAARTMADWHTRGLSDHRNGRPAHHGLGWFKPRNFSRTIGTERAIGHEGATSTLLWIEPDYDLVYVFLTNRWGQETRVAHMALNAVMSELVPRQT